MMAISLNELRFSVRWAALGIKAPPGLADDLAAAAVALACLVRDPVDPVVAVLEAFPATYNWGELRLLREGDVTHLSREGSPAAILELGPAVADLIRYSGGEPVKIGEPASPLLLIGYLKAAGLSNARLSWQGGAVRFDGEGDIMLENVADLQAVPDAPAVMDLENIEEQGKEQPMQKGQPSLLSEVVQRGVPISEDTWARLKAQTARAWVKGTEQSRIAGAGAGLVDKD